MSILEDGTVIPAHLSASSTDPRVTGFTRNSNDFLLRYGEVVAAYAPSNDQNVNKVHWEYDVNVSVTEGTTSQSFSLYPRARTGSMFGGVADYFRWTPRIVDKKNGQSQPLVGLGSIVLVLCLNGSRNGAVIIGGMKHPQMQQAEPENGHSLAWQFNGVQVVINNDGEFAIQRNGATGADGKVLRQSDEDGATFVLDKKGNVYIAGGTTSQSLFIDDENKKIVIEADQDVEIRAADKLTVDADKGIDLGKDAKDQLLLGTTYRNAEKDLHQAMIDALKGVTENLIQVGVALTAAAVPATAPSLTQAGSAITDAAARISYIIEKIQTFEEQDYLSSLNKTL